MDIDFWLQRWANNQIGFHENEVNPFLVEHFKALSLDENSRVFFPLCGKTLDIAWLLSQGYRVVGAELSRTAVEQLFIALEIEPDILGLGNVDHYSAKDIDIFVGDIFELSASMLGLVDAIYDRAALVALPEEMRKRYTKHLVEITDKAPQLLISFEYDQALLEGPPFSISKKEVNQHYGDSYDLQLIISADMPGGLKGKCPAEENVWLLKNDG